MGAALLSEKMSHNHLLPCLGTVEVTSIIVVSCQRRQPAAAAGAPTSAAQSGLTGSRRPQGCGARCPPAAAVVTLGACLPWRRAAASQWPRSSSRMKKQERLLLQRMPCAALESSQKSISRIPASPACIAAAETTAAEYLRTHTSATESSLPHPVPPSIPGAHPDIDPIIVQQCQITWRQPCLIVPPGATAHRRHRRRTARHDAGAPPGGAAAAVPLPAP